MIIIIKNDADELFNTYKYIIYINYIKIIKLFKSIGKLVSADKNKRMYS